MILPFLMFKLYCFCGDWWCTHFALTSCTAVHVNYIAGSVHLNMSKGCQPGLSMTSAHETCFGGCANQVPGVVRIWTATTVTTVTATIKADYWGGVHPPPLKIPAYVSAKSCSKISPGAWPSAQPPMDTRKNFLLHLSAESPSNISPKSPQKSHEMFWTHTTSSF